ncbi:MAG: YhdT family protein [Dethiobacteria bacterium]|jgi:uncharacterized membrane protein YhdT|nr:YhdT family protein [Bacillota bacterium]
MHKERNFQEDPRYRQANKEALIGIAIFILNIIWWYVFAYGLGSGPPEDYSYICGFPAWFFWSVIVNYVIFSFLIWGAVSFFFKDMPLETKDKEVEKHNCQEEN